MERMAWERFMQMERRQLKERREGKLRRALRDKRASHMRRGRKEASSYVLRRKQGGRAEPPRSTQRPRPESMVAALAEDYIAEHPGVSVPLNKTRSMGYQQRFVTALPDIHLEVLHVLAEGDHVLIHWTASGTHAERLATVTGETIPPTRRRVRVSGALLTEVR